MGEVLGFAYFVFGGVVAGNAIYAMHQDDVFEVDREKGETFPFVGFLLMAMIFWLAWPIVWGVTRAMQSTPAAQRASKEGHPALTGESDG